MFISHKKYFNHSQYIDSNTITYLRNIMSDVKIL